MMRYGDSKAVRIPRNTNCIAYEIVIKINVLCEWIGSFDEKKGAVGMHAYHAGRSEFLDTSKIFEAFHF